MDVYQKIICVLGGSHTFTELLRKHPNSIKLKKQVVRDLKLELKKLRVMASFLVQGTAVPRDTKKEYMNRFLKIQRLIALLDKEDGKDTGSMCKLDGGIQSCDLSAEAAHRKLMGKSAFKEEAVRRLVGEQSKCKAKYPSLDFKSNDPIIILDTVSTLAKTECINIQLAELASYD